MFFLQFTLYSPSLFGIPRKGTPRVALEIDQLGILQLSPSILTHFQLMFHFYNHQEHQKTGRFFMFSRSIEVESWLKIGQTFFTELVAVRKLTSIGFCSVWISREIFLSTSIFCERKLFHGPIGLSFYLSISYEYGVRNHSHKKVKQRFRRLKLALDMPWVYFTVDNCKLLTIFQQVLY